MRAEGEKGRCMIEDKWNFWLVLSFACMQFSHEWSLRSVSGPRSVVGVLKLYYECLEGFLSVWLGSGQGRFYLI